MPELKHVAIIMDGNGRWATSKNLPRSAGHKAGGDNLKKLALHILGTGVEVLSVYAFSTENFKRSADEVKFLMDLFVNSFKKEKNFFNKHNIKVVFSGREENLRSDVIKSMKELTELTSNNTGGTFNVCINYGGQSEIVDATKVLIKKAFDGSITIDEINEETYAKALYNNLPPVDFMVRTSGEARISNFMLYSLAYAEMYFTEVYFPDFDDKEYDKAVEYFNGKSRRFGGYDKINQK